MIDEARCLENGVKVNRTIASNVDTITGILGEFAFAEYFYGDWKAHRVGQNKGDVDFEDIEIKTSAFPFRDTLNLLVREDYALRRSPKYYVQVIIDVESARADDIIEGTKAYMCGYATEPEVLAAPKRDFGSKFGGRGGYKCFHIEITQLHRIEKLKEELSKE
jgi:hypothetical protein